MKLEEAIIHAEEKAKALGDCECAKEHLQLASWLKTLDLFHKAAIKQEKTLHSEFGGWGHSMFCNAPTDIGFGTGRCNCGVTDMLHALKEMEKLNVSK